MLALFTTPLKETGCKICTDEDSIVLHSQNAEHIECGYAGTEKDLALLGADVRLEVV